MAALWLHEIALQMKKSLQNWLKEKAIGNQTLWWINSDADECSWWFQLKLMQNVSLQHAVVYYGHRPTFFL